MDFMAALWYCTQKNWNSLSTKEENPSKYFTFTFKTSTEFTLRLEIRLPNMDIWLRNFPVLDWSQVIYPSATCQLIEWILSKGRKKKIIHNIYLMLKITRHTEWVNACICIYSCMHAWTNEYSWGREWAQIEIQVI